MHGEPNELHIDKIRINQFTSCMSGRTYCHRPCDVFHAHLFVRLHKELASEPAAQYYLIELTQSLCFELIQIDYNENLVIR